MVEHEPSTYSCRQHDRSITPHIGDLTLNLIAASFTHIAFTEQQKTLDFEPKRIVFFKQIGDFSKNETLFFARYVVIVGQKY